MIQTSLNSEVFVAAIPLLLRGLGVKVVLSLLVVPLGFASGLALALLSLSRSRVAREALVVWVDFVRTFPPLVRLIMLYAGLPFAGISLSPFGCVAIGFMLNARGYYGDVIRAGAAIRAARPTRGGALAGLSAAQALGCVVLPPALRNTTGSAVQHAGIGQAHLARICRGSPGTAVPGSAGAERHLQRDSNRSGVGIVLPAALARRASAEPA